ncbi:response regulator transcription factor [Pelomonas sp. KK5]|uniref:response regulator n=1 Tax=Pelomonas sp. KK5 TaxID=1855730 RepID=UPI00097BFA78|nr:response regulator transcription factor [Pelomonas sp. KK5]
MNPSVDPLSAARPTLSCFLVEDSPVIRENLIATFEEMLGMRVVGCAEDEQAALRWLQGPDSSCDLMIIDIFLKTGTGLEVLSHAKALRPGMKLVVLSNYATTEMRRRCLLLGADRVFDKSAELEELLAYCESVPENPSHQ